MGQPGAAGWFANVTIHWSARFDHQMFDTICCVAGIEPVKIASTVDIDLFSRQVAGFAMCEQMPRIVIDALRMACSGPPTNGLIFHSDRGSQYASGDFQKQRVTFGMKSSMRRKGDCWDNALVAETLFGSLKVERLHGMRFATRRQAKGRGDRLASVLQSPEASLELGYLSPIAFGKKGLADKEWLVA